MRDASFDWPDGGTPHLGSVVFSWMRLASSSPLHAPLHGPLRAMSAQLLRYAAASSLVPAGWCSPAAAYGQQPYAGGLLAPARLPLGPLAAFCTSPESPCAASVLRARE